MKKRDTLHSFHDLDASRFQKKPSAAKAGKTGTLKKVMKKAEPDIAAESALFLAAVAGTIDVSMKNPAGLPAEGAREEERLFGAAVALIRDEPTTPSAPRHDAPPAATADAAPFHVASEEGTLFTRAMDGVAPIRAKGRDLAPAAPLPDISPDAVMPTMDGIFSGKLEFSLEYTDEFVQGHILGLDPVVLGKLKAGAYSHEGHIDLHGNNMEQAYSGLAAFIKHAYQGGKRHVLVITGRGKNSPGGTLVLRERVQAWFTRDPFKRVILAFCTAKPGDGGAGALYLLLRKRKKSQGKIVWDRMPSEEELLL